MCCSKLQLHHIVSMIFALIGYAETQSFTNVRITSLFLEFDINFTYMLQFIVISFHCTIKTLKVIVVFCQFDSCFSLLNMLINAPFYRK